MIIHYSSKILHWLSHFWPMFLFYNPLKTLENQRSPGGLKEYKMGVLAINELLYSINPFERWGLFTKFFIQTAPPQKM